MEPKLLEVRDLRTHFVTRRGTVKAVDGVSFSLHRAETLGIVGESGCGKTITSLSVLRLLPPGGHIVGGEIFFDGQDLLSLSLAEMKKYRGRRISMILQDPMSSLNPVFTIGNQVAEAILTHQRVKGSVWKKVIEVLTLLRIPSPEARITNFPHQLSGGMRQRVVGAIALSCEPELIIADEPTTSLDVTIQDQYLRLLKDIQKESGVSLIFITHDFGIVARMCDRVCVMYAGKIVESAEIRELFNSPLHPYTCALLQSLPKLGKRVNQLPSIEGQPPNLLNLPPGCTFAPRCSNAEGICFKDQPPMNQISADHSIRCWHLHG